MKARIAVIIFLLSLAGMFAADAQSFYNRGATVSVLPGTIFSVKDSLVNTGRLVNNGNLVMGGTWLNTGTYDAGTGEITFNSPSSATPQIINHSNQSFSKLTISGGGRKVILADITIEDEIILAEGIIQAENNARVVVSSSASVSGGSDQAHINAPVYHQGSGEKIFPLGNGLVYLPVILKHVTDASAFVGIRGIELETHSLIGAPSLDNISSTRYWHIDVADGSLQGSMITLPARDEAMLSNAGNLERVVVAEAPSLAENFRSIGQAGTTGTASNGTVSSERFVTMPYVTLATTGTDGDLTVYNALSPNGDRKNDFLIIENIEYHAENKVTIFNRWGDKVFEIDNYDNLERVFRGKSNINGGKDLVNGTYFYVIETKDGLRVNGFLALKN